MGKFDRCLDLILEEILDEYKAGWDNNANPAFQTDFRNPTIRDFNEIWKRYKERHNEKFGLPPIRGVYHMPTEDFYIWSEEMVMHTEFRRKYKLPYSECVDVYISRGNSLSLQDPQKISKADYVAIEQAPFINELGLILNT